MINPDEHVVAKISPVSLLCFRHACRCSRLQDSQREMKKVAVPFVKQPSRSAFNTVNIIFKACIQLDL